ncbi:MAG: DivIVA domain-containing protein [Candidatus Alcyoniella australis]|nr:DivIVA domain-containing protein [Candidatus Alcyoniella australis]
MKITPLDIQQQQFKKKGGRYNAAEVDSFLELVRAELESKIGQNEEQRERLRQLENQIAALREQENTLKSALLSCQRVTDDIIANARKEAEVIVAESKLRGERQIDQAHAEVARVSEEINELKRQRTVLEANLRGIIDTHRKLLEGLTEQASESDADAKKVSQLK